MIRYHIRGVIITIFSIDDIKKVKDESKNYRYYNSAFYSFVTQDVFQFKRDEIDQWVASYPTITQNKLIKKLHNPEEFLQTYHELATGNVLKKLGFDIEYEKPIKQNDGITKTPDWFIHKSLKAPEFIVDVYTANTSQKYEARKYHEHDLFAQLRTINKGVVIDVSLPESENFLVPPNFTSLFHSNPYDPYVTALKELIKKETENWLMQPSQDNKLVIHLQPNIASKFESNTFDPLICSIRERIEKEAKDWLWYQSLNNRLVIIEYNEYYDEVYKVQITIEDIQIPSLTHTEITTVSGGWIRTTGLRNRLLTKSKVYDKIVNQNHLPYVVSCVANVETPYLNNSFDKVIKGDNAFYDDGHITILDLKHESGVITKAPTMSAAMWVYQDSPDAHRGNWVCKVIHNPFAVYKLPNNTFE